MISKAPLQPGPHDHSRGFRSWDNVPRQRIFALLRGGTHHFRLPSSWVHDHPFLILPRENWPHGWARPRLADASVTIAGELCTPKDILARDVRVERVRIGDLACFLMAGAYGWDISHHDFLCHAYPERLFLEAGWHDVRKP